ncbi:MULTISPECIES: 50S ribosomal protein L11 methyltransferase [Streptomyces]|uniref:50S ribosomal protein L11 methyltransferase n=1 Tax=Streptomyces TaxID=1883 RepID=UPI00292EC1B0|nr:50S ribosomal protein L11 methyltransferase [Streptomyces sp. NEAU-HV9]
MSEIKSYLHSLARSRDSMRPEHRTGVFSLCGREWDLLDTVFAPLHAGTTEIVLDMLGLTDPVGRPWRGAFLEVGCGTGVVAVAAALAGCERVVASDINAEAVANAALNARRHGVADRVRAVHSDLFEGLPAGQLFDTIVWSSPYVRAPEHYRFGTDLERAYVDPGYEAHRRYVNEAPRRLTNGGRALLHFSSRGDLDGLHRIAEETGRRLRVLSRHVVADRGDVVEHFLVEIRSGERSSEVYDGAVLRGGLRTPPVRTMTQPA